MFAKENLQNKTKKKNTPFAYSAKFVKYTNLMIISNPCGHLLVASLCIMKSFFDRCKECSHHKTYFFPFAINPLKEVSVCAFVSAAAAHNHNLLWKALRWAHIK